MKKGGKALHKISWRSVGWSLKIHALRIQDWTSFASGKNIAQSHLAQSHLKILKKMPDSPCKLKKIIPKWGLKK